MREEEVEKGETRKRKATGKVVQGKKATTGETDQATKTQKSAQSNRREKSKKMQSPTKN